MDWRRFFFFVGIYAFVGIVVHPFLSRAKYHISARIAQRQPQLSAFKGRPALLITPPKEALVAILPCFAILGAGAIVWWYFIVAHIDWFTLPHYGAIVFVVAVGCALGAASVWFGLASAHIIMSRMWVFRDGILILAFGKTTRFVTWAEIESIHTGIARCTVKVRDGKRFSFDMMWSSTAFLYVCFEQALQESQWKKVKESFDHELPKLDLQPTRNHYESVMSRGLLAPSPVDCL